MLQYGGIPKRQRGLAVDQLRNCFGGSSPSSTIVGILGLGLVAVGTTSNFLFKCAYSIFLKIRSLFKCSFAKGAVRNTQAPILYQNIQVFVTVVLKVLALKSGME